MNTLESRQSDFFKKPADEFGPGQVDSLRDHLKSVVQALCKQMKAAGNDLEIMSFSQIGVPGKAMVCRNGSDCKLLINPRIISLDTSEYVYLQTPRLHTDGDYIQRYANTAVIEWDLEDGSVERHNMYGIQAALFQCAVGYLEGIPPWMYDPIGDW